MTCVGIYLYFNGFPEFLHLLLEGSDRVGRDPAILPAEDTENLGIDLLQRGIVSSEMTVIDDIDRELGLRNRKVQRIAASHAPSNRADLVLLNIGLRRQVIVRGQQVTLGTILGNTAHQFMGFIRSG